MSARTYWKLLVLFVVLCQGIIGTIAEKDIDESSELLVRQKRVINRQPGGDIAERIRDLPYVVLVKKYKSRKFCAGVILSNDIFLTLAKCVAPDIESYRVYSGNARRPTADFRVGRHSIREKIVVTSSNTHRTEEGISLMSVVPPFVFSENTYSIPLYEGNIYPRSYVTVSGWGCHANGDPGTAHPNYLRSITVPIISNRDCAVLHTDSFRILDSHICTFDSSGQQYCGADDDGAPLVITVNNVMKLVGIHLWSGRGVRGLTYPDVFLNLQYPTYKTGIARNIPILTRNANSSRNPQNNSNLHQPHKQPRIQK